jgi:polyadenylate-binding protein
MLEPPYKSYITRHPSAIAHLNALSQTPTTSLYVSLIQRHEIRKQQLESQIAQRNQIRMQPDAAAGLPARFLNGPMYYPPDASLRVAA